MKRQTKKCQQRLFPEAVHFHVADQRQVIEILLLRERHRAPKDIRFQIYVGIGKEKPLTGRDFERFLQAMRFAEPAAWKLGDMDSAKTRMRRGKIIKNAACGILRAIVHANYFQMWIVERGKSCKRSRELFFFISRGEQKRDFLTAAIFRRPIIPDPGEFRCAVGAADSVEHPDGGDERENNESKSVHQNWYRVMSSGYPNM